MERNLRDLLDAAVGEPPRPVTAAAVRRRAARRRLVRAVAVTLAVVLAAGLSAAVSAGAIRIGASPVSRVHQRPGLPRYYVSQVYGLTVRSTATGRITAVIPSQLAGARCGGGNVGFAAAAHQTFFMACLKGRSTGTPPVSGHGRLIRHRRPGKIFSLETLIYRFRVTGSGRITSYSLVRGGVLHGVWAFNIAAAADGSQVAAEVLRPDPSGQLYTNAVPVGIVVINTTTGATALWHSGPYRAGALQYAGAQNLSFTRDGQELVVKEARCRRGRYQVFCNGNADNEVRAYGPPGRGGSLERGQILLRESALRPHGTGLSDAIVSPGGSQLTAVLTHCPRRGTCTLSVAWVQVGTGRILQVLYRTRTGTPYQGIFERFFSSDPSGRYLILDAGAGGARVNGWIDHGRLIRLVPADGNAPVYETW